MRERKRFRKATAMVCLVSLAAGFSGCGEKEEKKTLRVITDQRLYDKVDMAARFMEGIHSRIRVEIQTLPGEGPERETEIEKLRTEIMAGKGPDVYLLESDQDNIAEVRSYLLENPYQAMQSGALAPLDEYMEGDTYWENSTYNEAFLKAGRFDGRQYIIPLAGDWFVLAQKSGIDEMEGDTLWEWIEQAEASSDIQQKMAFRGIWQGAGRWMQPAVDYENQEVFFDKEEWKEFVKQWVSFLESTDAMIEESGSGFSLNFIESVGYEPGTTLRLIPDMNGHKVASVGSYGAVGMSSDYKEESYELIMLLLNERTRKYKEEKHDRELPVLDGWIDFSGAPLQENAVQNWMSSADEHVAQEVVECLREIENVYFMTEAEWNLYTELSALIFDRYEPSIQMEQKISEIADTTWNIYKKLVSE